MKTNKVVAKGVYILILISLSMALSVAAQADLILYNGKIITVDPQDHIYQAIAVKDGKILALGTDQEIMALAGVHCLMVNLKGKTATPGLIDSHYHLMYYGRQFWPGFLNIRHPDVQSKDDLLQVISQYVQGLEPDDWVSGNQGFILKMNETIDRYDIDGVAPNNPAYLRHCSGQYAVVNTRALDIAGIDKDTPNPHASLIMHDEDGEPTGILSHYPAENLVAQHAPGYGDRTEEEKFDDIEKGQELCLQAGYTSIQDVIVGSSDDIRAYRMYAEAGKLKVRLYAMLYLNTEEQANYYAQNYHPIDTGRFVFGGWKLAMDGGLAAKTTLFYDKTMFASLLSYPYHEQETFNRIISTLHNTGLQIAVHVGGDEGIDMVLAGLERAMQANPRPDPRHRIEHGLFPTMAAMQKMKELGIILSTQPQWITWYGDGYQEVTNEATMALLLPFRTMLSMGIHMAFGCDVPASPYQEPKWAFAGAVARRSSSGIPLSPAERMTIQEALYTHTMGSAYASYSEDVTGSLEPGKYADIVVWSHDLYTISGPAINDLAAEMTIVEGEILHDTGILPMKYAVGTWQSAGQMLHPRESHTATLLQDGRVLIVGWSTNEAELYNPFRNSFTATGATVKNHYQGSTATLLNDGTVLIAGGVNAQKYAELYDPATGLFTLISDTLHAPRCFHTATLMPDGKVLIAAGQDKNGPQTHDKAEIYDPQARTFTLTGSLTQHRSGHTATLLQDGTVLITGGTQTTTPGSGFFLDACERYDPVTGTFSAIQSMHAPRISHAATLLPDGRALISGGAWDENRNELYDSKTDTWSYTGKMNVTKQTDHSATLLNNGHVLLAGGRNATTTMDSVQIYYPETDTYYSVDNLLEKRTGHTATLLDNGSLLIAGGCNDEKTLQSAELYRFDPTTDIRIKEDEAEPEILSDFTLSPNYPNPFNAGTRFHYRLATAQRVHIAVYNLRGELIRTLVHASGTAGTHQVSWDGLSDTGGQVGTGVYMVRMTTNERLISRKVLLLK
ncbi:amidohydrolase family protein [candidate division KSB1 bacterium]|nr:amidohydrolase family protein [candidate division KSB1 bacterium]